MANLTTRILKITLFWCVYFKYSIARGFEKPNVLFIVIDDLRASLGCYGGPIISPNIDQLAAQSAVFTNAMVQQALCAPSRTSFLTGRRPDTTKLYDFGSYWRTHAGNYTTLPQHFKENGYFTASVGKVFHPGVPSGGNDDYPYSWSIPAYHPSTEQYQYATVCPKLDEILHKDVMCPVDINEMPEKSLPDLQAFERAAEILRNLSEKHMVSENIDTTKEFADNDEVRESAPFFLAVGYRKPHVPWKYPKGYKDLYPLSSVEIAPDPEMPEKLPSVAWVDFHSLRLWEDIEALNLSFPFGTIPLDYHGPMRQNYYAAATYTDFQVGRLLNVLEESGFANNTIIVFVGDHGFHLGEHGEWLKMSNFELTTRVPLMVHVPGVTDVHWSSATKFALKDPLTKGTASKKNDISSLLQDNLILDHQGKDSGQEGEARDYNNRVEGADDGVTNDRGMAPKNGAKMDEFVELVDIFPTLSELADLAIPPICPPKSFDVDVCAEGVSFAPLIESRMMTGARKSLAFKRWKNATFSQYPRPGVTPGKHSDIPHLANITVMGYSMRTANYHYTEWIGFDHTTFEGDWSDVKARELYINQLDPDQDNNVAGDSKYAQLVEDLSRRLQRGWRDCLPDMKRG